MQDFEKEQLDAAIQNMLSNAFEYARYKINETGSSYSNLNLSSIATKLIQDTGRFCEHYASDFIINWNELTEYIEHLDTIDEPECRFFAFGIRQDGVDGNIFLTCRLTDGYHNEINANTRNNYYRKIYVVKAEKYLDQTNCLITNITLADIQYSIHDFTIPGKEL